MKRLICFLKQSQLCWMVSGVIIWRISVRPDGSPIMPVPPPSQGDRLVACHLQTFHQAQCHEMSYMKAVCGRVKTDIENGFSFVDQFFDLFFVCNLGDQTSGY